MYLAQDINTRIEGSELVTCLNKTVTSFHLNTMINEIVKPFGARCMVQPISQNADVFKGRGDIKKTDVLLGADYSGERKRNKVTIFIRMLNPQMKISLTRPRLNKLIFLVAECLQHELNHQTQEKKIGKAFYTNHLPVAHSQQILKSRKDNIKYLSNTEEIDSFAHDLAMEIKFWYPKHSPKEIFNTLDSRKLLKAYSAYRNTFRGVEWTHIRKTLLKKTWKWLPKVIPPSRV